MLLVLIGFVSVTFNTLGNSSVQLASTPELRGRVMSLYMLVFMGGTPIGSLIVGWITEQWGAPMALIISGAVCVVAAVIAAIFAARSAGISIHLNLHHRGRSAAGLERGLVRRPGDVDGTAFTGRGLPKGGPRELIRDG